MGEGIERYSLRIVGSELEVRSRQVYHGGFSSGGKYGYSLLAEWRTARIGIRKAPTQLLNVIKKIFILHPKTPKHFV